MFNDEDDDDYDDYEVSDDYDDVSYDDNDDDDDDSNDNDDDDDEYDDNGIKYWKIKCQTILAAKTLNIKLKLIRFNLPVGRSTLFTKINISFFAPSFILLRIICTNYPIVKSVGIIYLQIQNDDLFNYNQNELLFVSSIWWN